ncbi:EAL domain-containing protein [Pararhodospirillum oryzae]|uniref:Diguanylate phosphodiesterase n=1 Tax=Pararhodospirillum oryzae TaxID=478448 RepID=A0A512H7Y6_9PROT|nr:EAL domain-containing protein [Pararhodospirillum oryzae]GEO81562.1 diguanylate phosphodiesterase [Pararhodospirillum oryzae]
MDSFTPAESLDPALGSDETPPPAESLAALIAWIQDNLGRLLGSRAARVRVSGLRRPADAEALGLALRDLARDPDVRVFALPGGDLLVLLHQTDAPRLCAVLAAFCAAHPRNPLCRTLPGPGQDTPLIRWHSLTREGAALLAWAERVLVAHKEAAGGPQAPPGSRQRLAAPGAPGPMRPRGRPLTPEVLDRLERGLADADLSSQVRRQRMVAVEPDGQLRPVGTELFMNIGELRQTIAPEFDLASNPWLFRRLTATLDRCMVTHIGGYVAAVDTPLVSVNLNLDTILGPGFQAIQAAAALIPHGTIVLELRLDDIMADLPAYLYAREYVHQHGFKVLIDGLGAQALLWIDRTRLGADYLKAMWSPDMKALLAAPEGAVLSARLRAFDPRTLILGRCDDAAAVEAGRSLGCTVFQGFYLDELLRDGRAHAPPSP